LIVGDASTAFPRSWMRTTTPSGVVLNSYDPTLMINLSPLKVVEVHRADAERSTLALRSQPDAPANDDIAHPPVADAGP
jgi:hypothetical protein